MNIKEMLKGSKVTGIHCSKCDFLIESAMPGFTNEDIFHGAAMHHHKFHSGEVGEEKTTYDIQATRSVLLPPAPVQSVELTIK